jgi:hypothetical protein
MDTGTVDPSAPVSSRYLHACRSGRSHGSTDVGLCSFLVETVAAVKFVYGANSKHILPQELSDYNNNDGDNTSSGKQMCKHLQKQRSTKGDASPTRTQSTRNENAVASETYNVVQDAQDNRKFGMRKLFGCRLSANLSNKQLKRHSARLMLMICINERTFLSKNRDHALSPTKEKQLPVAAETKNIFLDGQVPSADYQSQLNKEIGSLICKIVVQAGRTCACLFSAEVLHRVWLRYISTRLNCSAEWSNSWFIGVNVTLMGVYLLICQLIIWRFAPRMDSYHPQAMALIQSN